MKIADPLQAALIPPGRYDPTAGATRRLINFGDDLQAAGSDGGGR
jgi:hypothetical protein